ncbi:MAG TPA: non-ribosomal peptide synthetase, partial [Oceanospirillales bacterium]|nr:non-ribosomal peptide synthetase [Oceanospirillales bacterium]
MQDIVTIINKLTQSGIQVFLQDDKLRTKSVKGALTPELIALIKSNKDVIINQLKSDLHSPAANKHKPISKRKGSQVKTSFAQQRLWFIDQIDGGSEHYNMPFILDIKGNFDIAVAEQAFALVIRRHAPLRTVFINQDSKPLQHVLEQFEFHLKVEDLRHTDKHEQDIKIASAIKHDAQKSFDLSTDLMFRAHYLQLQEQQGLLLFCLHHIAADGWSIKLLMAEFSHNYKLLQQNKAADLPALKIEYADYAYWQYQWIIIENGLDQQLKYWQQQLYDLPPVHELPLDFDRPQYQTFNGKMFHFELTESTLIKLKNIALDNQASLFMLMHAAFALLIARYANSHDVVIGTPVANRTQKELEDIIGFFANTLVLRADCGNNPIFTDFLSQIRNTNLDAQANQDLP